MKKIKSVEQYNDKYTNVFYENKNRRLYNELTTTSLDALYSETQIKIIELFEKYDFKLFYITCSAKTFYKVKFTNNYCVNLSDKDVKVIKNLLGEDIYYLYKNQLFEILYKIPYLNENNNYYYNMLIFIKDNNFLNEIVNYNFNLIKIESVSSVFKEQITFNFIKNIFENKVNFDNQTPSCDSDCYRWKILSNKDYIIQYCDGDINKFDLDEYNNISSYYNKKNFNQNFYAKSCFKLLDMGIFSFDKYYIIKVNKKGSSISYINKFDMNSAFLTNWSEIAGLVSAEIDDNGYNIKNIEYYHSCLYDNDVDQCINSSEFDRRWTKTGFIDLNNLEIYHESEIFEGNLLKNRT